MTTPNATSPYSCAVGPDPALIESWTADFERLVADPVEPGAILCRRLDELPVISTEWSVEEYRAYVERVREVAGQATTADPGHVARGLAKLDAGLGGLTDLQARNAPRDDDDGSALLWYAEMESIGEGFTGVRAALLESAANHRKLLDSGKVLGLMANFQSTSTMLVVKHGDTPVGAALFHDDGRTMKVDDLTASPRCIAAGTRVGSVLMEGLVRHAKSQGLHEVSLSPLPGAEPAYEHWGFKHVVGGSMMVLEASKADDFLARYGQLAPRTPAAAVLERVTALANAQTVVNVEARPAVVHDQPRTTQPAANLGSL